MYEALDVNNNNFKIQFDMKKDPGAAAGADTSSTMALDDETHLKLIQYLQARLQKSIRNRTNRITRYAKTDQTISTWQKLTPQDSIRDTREDNTGKSQAIPMNLPLVAAHVDDAVAFYAEIFSPLGGNFYTNPATKNENESMKALVEMMNADSQYHRYYMNVCSAMRSLNKYNFGGFHVCWQDGDKSGVGQDTIAGNVVEALDMYNFLYDESIVDVNNFHLEGEYGARIRLRSRLWLTKQWLNGDLINVDKVLNKFETANVGNQSAGNKARYYKNPPANTKMDLDGQDTRTDRNGPTGDTESNVDWAEFGLSLDSEKLTDIDGHEIIHMYCWLNPNQFALWADDVAEADKVDKLELWEFTICDAEFIIKLAPVPDAREIPLYISRLNLDDMKEAARAIAEYVKPFQRFVSFLLNTHVEGIRASIWGLKVYDPTMIDVKDLRSGETSGLLPTKKPGVDVRTAIQQTVQNNGDTRQNLTDAGGIMDLMKQFFPNQALPSQIAGLDRAVNSQVQAVMQGAMRKLHMFVRLLDSSLMQPTRMAQYRNLAINSPDKAKITGLSEPEVARLLNSGLGQLGREAAAGQLQTLIFAIIQNQSAMGTFDIPGLFTLWSQLLNIGTDLGDYVVQPAAPATSPQGNPIAGATTATAPADGSAGGVPPGIQPGG